MNQYDHQKIEPYWRNKWREDSVYKTESASEKPKFYVLDMFPYPSGQGLHVGHPKGYIGSDVFSRFKRMQGFNVLHPMGFDAFGLPAENYAIKNKIHPSIAVEKNIETYKLQLESIGFDYDWTREINTTDPKYYKWTQWIFLKLLEKGLAYESFEPINWCPSCQTGLANEDLEDGVCERCKSLVEKKMMRQWILRITDYAEKLLADLDQLDWPESIKESQRNWIGKSEGAEFDFGIIDSSGNKISDENISVFTTRADTIFGVTYVVIAPEHPLTEKLSKISDNENAIKEYIAQASKISEIDRTAETREKTGVVIEGVLAINPANGEKVPVWVADYVLGSYGTGAVMAVPAHDLRDELFAKKYDLPIRVVIDEDDKLIESSNFNGQKSEKARVEISKKFGRLVTKYKLREWVFSRQRYWGEPIPVVHCAKDGVVPIAIKDLPVQLPEVEFYEPTGTGESPLAEIADWVNTTCPKCGGPAKRETNTMPQWAGSCWYYLRYMDPDNETDFVDPKIEKYWSPVDVYVGGAEHATRHLVYARFWHKFLFDCGLVSTSEPFLNLRNQGLIMGPDGQKMSKSLGNVINPDEYIETYGADTFRLFEMFLGPFSQQADWNTESIIGPRRFIEKVWRIAQKAIENNSQETSPEVSQTLHQTIEKVTKDISDFGFNTCISSLMICANAFDGASNVSVSDVKIFIQLLAPFAPHVCEELWKSCGGEDSIHKSKWPIADQSKLKKTEVKIVFQVDGKVRHTEVVPAETDDQKLKEMAVQIKAVKDRLNGKEPERIIVVSGKLVNVVTAK